MGDRSAGLTAAFYGRGGAGAAPYYGVFDALYVGNAHTGIRFEDAEDAVGACNSITVRDSRFQPGRGNVGVYVGSHCQNIRILDNCFEAIGGTGLHLAGVACLVSGNRFESMEAAIAYRPGARSNIEFGNYYDSNQADRTGFEEAVASSVIHGSSRGGDQSSHLAGTVDIESALMVAGQRVVGPRKTGWSLPSGRSNRGTFDTRTVTTAELAERVKALLEDLHAQHGHGLLGS